MGKQTRRPKHPHPIPPGKGKYIKTPEDLWGLFEDYMEWAHNNPWIKYDAIKSGPNAGQLIEIPHERPLTVWGFARHLGMSLQGIMNYESNPAYEPYFKTYARIKAHMQAQRIDGGMVDGYNANLVARIDGIKERAEIEGAIEPLIVQDESGSTIFKVVSTRGSKRAEDTAS